VSGIVNILILMLYGACAWLALAWVLFVYLYTLALLKRYAASLGMRDARLRLRKGKVAPHEAREGE